MASPGFGIRQVFTIGAHVLQVVQSPVKVNDVPSAIAQPGVNFGDAIRRWPAVSQWAMDVGLAFQHFSNGDRVANRNRIPDQKYSRQSRSVLDPDHGWIGFTSRLFLGLLFGVIGSCGSRKKTSQQQAGRRDSY